MGKSKRFPPHSSEQHILDHLQVVLLSDPDDTARYDQLIVEPHFPHDATLVGEHRRYAAVYQRKGSPLCTARGPQACVDLVLV